MLLPRIDGRGTIVAGAGIGGGFRLVAPFSLILDEMVFLSHANSPLKKMDYETRNKIRNSLISAELNFDVYECSAYRCRVIDATFK